MKKSQYLDMRNTFKPTPVKLAFILESPPISGKYFYNEMGSINEPLFSAMMKLLGIQVETKREGLVQFMNRGCLIVDSTYNPVNHLKGKKRNDAILLDFESLLIDLKNLSKRGTFPLFLVKANICRTLGSKLSQEGYEVVNQDRVVPFPSHGNQLCFQIIAKEILTGLEDSRIFHRENIA
ncbi:MAG: hypothetical protein HN590_06160 [Calditrichaeota bacterium]|jgi:hypothetical protein|nr:hypothetical protein [Calditrichota bacterium]